MTQTSESSSQPAWQASDLAENPHEKADKADRVRRMFAAIAGAYDLNNRVHSFGRDQAWRRKAVRLCRVGPNDHVLDVACGTGDLAEHFARARPATVTGLDFTEPMLDVARNKAARARRAEGVPVPEYVQGDAQHLPFDDQSFDIVSIAFGIRNVTDPACALAEFRRVLRPGGRLVILEFSEPRNRLLRAGNRFYTRRVMPWTATLLARDRSGAYHYLPRSVETFLDRGAMCDAVKAAGFSRVSVHPMAFGVCVAYLSHVEPAAAPDV